MSSYFDEASLVMIPSGYKDQKVYSVKPLDGSGDLTFSRASSATRVASNGLIEKVRTNLILQSQDFSTSWSANSCTVATNTTANPLNGAVDADTITFTGGTTQKYVIQAFSFNGNYTVSAYLKAGTNQFVQFLLGSDAGVYANFDLVNGTASAAGSTATIVAAGSGFFRCSMSFTSTTGTHVFIQAVDSLSAARFATTTSTGTLIAFGYQLEVGDIATDYIATTSAAVSVGPVSGLPRLDYLNSTCPRLLLEPQRSNSILQSENLSSATWTKEGGTITANATASPDGYSNADLFTEDTSTGNHRVYQAPISTSVNQAVTFSVFAKYNGRQYLYLRIDNVTVFTAVFDIQNGTAGTVTSGATSKIENYGNGWYRCAITLPAGAAASVCEGLVGFLSGSSFSSASYTGNGTSGAYLWGFQGEVNAAYATSYIPTLGTSVTRVAEVASKTGISSLIGQTEGTLFAEFTRLNVGNAVVMFQLNDGTTNNRAQIEISSSGQLLGVVLSGGGVTCLIFGPTLTLGQTYKVAFTYKLNDFKLYVDGVLVGSDTSGAVPVSMSRLDVASELGTSYAGVSVAQFLNFPTALTSAQLADLTA